jgi:CRP-like cAMP-binding protein
MVVNRHTTPGTFIGEIGALLGQPRSASVTAVAPTVVRDIGNPDEFFAAHPELGVEVARQLAARLTRLTAYIVDVQHRFADRDDHLGVFGELLGRIAGRPPIDIEPGSDRSPDY